MDPEESQTREPLEDAELASESLDLVTGGAEYSPFNYTFNKPPVKIPTVTDNHGT
jgi:hypothetical protein